MGLSTISEDEDEGNPVIPILLKTGFQIARGNASCTWDLGRDTRTSTQSRRLARRKDASWDLNWHSGANLLVHKPHKYILCVPL